MSAIAIKKVTISLPEELLRAADVWAESLGSNRSKVIADLLAEKQVRERDALAAEGYRFYAQESEEFAEASSQAVAEAWGDDDPPR